jgi:hypothetical protein
MDHIVPIIRGGRSTKNNVADMVSVVDLAGEYGVRNAHYLWLFQKGKADDTLFISAEASALRKSRRS